MEAEAHRKPGQYEFQNLLNSIFKQESETPNGGQGQPRSSDDLLFWAFGANSKATSPQSPIIINLH